MRSEGSAKAHRATPSDSRFAVVRGLPHHARFDASGTPCAWAAGHGALFTSGRGFWTECGAMFTAVTGVDCAQRGALFTGRGLWSLLRSVGDGTAFPSAFRRTDFIAGCEYYQCPFYDGPRKRDACPYVFAYLSKRCPRPRGAPHPVFVDAMSDPQGGRSRVRLLLDLGFAAAKHSLLHLARGTLSRAERSFINSLLHCAGRARARTVRDPAGAQSGGRAPPGTQSNSPRRGAPPHVDCYTAVSLHCSGETTDAFIADVAAATNCGRIKRGRVGRTVLPTPISCWSASE